MASCPFSRRSARPLAPHVPWQRGLHRPCVIAWSRTGDPDLGEWGPPEVLFRTGTIPDEYEAGGGVGGSQIGVSGGISYLEGNR